MDVVRETRKVPLKKLWNSARSGVYTNGTHREATSIIKSASDSKQIREEGEVGAHVLHRDLSDTNLMLWHRKLVRPTDTPTSGIQTSSRMFTNTRASLVFSMTGTWLLSSQKKGNFPTVLYFIGLGLGRSWLWTCCSRHLRLITILVILSLFSMS